METTTYAAGAWTLPAVPLRPLMVRVFVPGHALAEQSVARGRSGPVKIVMPAGSKLHLARRELGELVLYALSPAPADAALMQFVMP